MLTFFSHSTHCTITGIHYKHYKCNKHQKYIPTRCLNLLKNNSPKHSNNRPMRPHTHAPSHPQAPQTEKTHPCTLTPTNTTNRNNTPTHPHTHTHTTHTPRTHSHTLATSKEIELKKFVRGCIVLPRNEEKIASRKENQESHFAENVKFYNYTQYSGKNQTT